MPAKFKCDREWVQLDDSLECPDLSDDDFRLMDSLNYWLEGVFLVVVALLGIIGNFLSSLILARKAMRNSFNILLVALALFDTTYLVSHVPYENHKLAPICKKRLCMVK